MNSQKIALVELWVSLVAFQYLVRTGNDVVGAVLAGRRSDAHSWLVLRSAGRTWAVRFVVTKGRVTDLPQQASLLYKFVICNKHGQ